MPFATCIAGVETVDNVAPDVIDVGDSAWGVYLVVLPAPAPAPAAPNSGVDPDPDPIPIPAYGFAFVLAAARPAAAAAFECLAYWRDDARRFRSHGRRGVYW